jgi:hypothetical protein
MDSVGQKFFIGICQPREKERLSDYDYLIIKSYQKKGNRRSTIPQLGEQSQQSIPPLEVLSKENESIADFVVETKLTKAQLQGEDNIPIHPRQPEKRIILGEPLMWPELVKLLPMRMRQLHECYMRTSTDGDIMFATWVKDSHLWRGLADV